MIGFVFVFVVVVGCCCVVIVRCFRGRGGVGGFVLSVIAFSLFMVVLSLLVISVSTVCNRH